MHACAHVCTYVCMDLGMQVGSQSSKRAAIARDGCVYVYRERFVQFCGQGMVYRVARQPIFVTPQVLKCFSVAPSDREETDLLQTSPVGVPVVVETG